MSYTFQKDKINPDSLNQSTHWFDRTGKEYRIEQMSKWHASGAMKKLYGAFGVTVITTPLYNALSRQARSGRRVEY